MTRNHFRTTTVAVGGLVAAAVVVAAAISPTDRYTARVIDDLAQLVGAIAAVGCCLWTARQARGSDRSWRILMAIGMVGWTVGQGLWTYYRTFDLEGVPSPSPADIGYLTLPVFALPALLVLGSGRSPSPAAQPFRGSRVRLLLDGLIVVGSLFILTWSTALGAVVRGGAPTAAAFAIAIAYPATDLVLVVIVVLLGSDRRVRWQRQLLLLGLGMVALSASDSAFVYFVSSGANDIPTLYDTGFVAGPVLVLLAALAPREPSPRGAVGPRHSPFSEWAYLLMPYVPLLVTGALVGTLLIFGKRLDPVEMWIGAAVVTVVVGRQLITIVDNARLLERLRESQLQLEYQAFHDSLTGLANRTLFHERLTHAIEDRMPFGLLFVDLDDFKTVNDQSGHASGDAVLAVVGQRLAGSVRGTDIVARLGGDEFAVLAEGLEEPERVAMRILHALAEPIMVGEQWYTVRASVGVVVCGDHDRPLTTDELLHQADAAMYEAKRQGKGGLIICQTGRGPSLLN
jgi:diguanylate cyclase